MRTGFQGGLNWYRARVEPQCDAELALFAGRTIDVPSCFIAGKSDWGVHRKCPHDRGLFHGGRGYLLILCVISDFRIDLLGLPYLWVEFDASE